MLLSVHKLLKKIRLGCPLPLPHDPVAMLTLPLWGSGQWSARPWLAQTCSYYIFAFGHRPLQCDNAGHSSNQCLGRSQERRQYAIVLSVCSSPQRCHTRGLCHINFNGGGHQMNQLSGLVRLCEWISVDQRIKTKQVVRFIDEHIIISFSALNYNSQ